MDFTNAPRRGARWASFEAKKQEALSNKSSASPSAGFDTDVIRDQAVASTFFFLFAFAIAIVGFMRHSWKPMILMACSIFALEKR